MKRLVEVDRDTRFALAVDEKRAFREAQALMNYLDKSGNELPEPVRESVTVVVASILNGSLQLPIGLDAKPLNLAHLRDIGIDLPSEFLELYSRLFNTATGSRIDASKFEERDGRLFAWMQFED